MREEEEREMERLQKREREGGETGDQWDLCFLTGTMNHM